MTTSNQIPAEASLPAVPVTVSGQLEHISVCICTLKRGDLLLRTLKYLENQNTEGLFTYSVVVADNDKLESAREAVDSFSKSSPLRIVYCVELVQNIAKARNKALENADGSLIAFIDDDEFAVPDWLLHLFKMYKSTGAAGVLGPVAPHFDIEPPKWVRKGKFFVRPAHPNGHIMRWEQCRTGNVLFRRSVLNSLEVPFREKFDTAGEDMDFFRRAIEKGHFFVWCNEAVAYEVVPPARCTRSYLLRRALLRGSNFHKHPKDRLRNIMKSIIALPCYTIVLPFLSLFGQHVFLKYLIKVFDHASRLVAFLGFSLVTERQT